MDLNLLIATVITATAALIAIIGGFLISRVITLSSEQSGIRRRLREIMLDIKTKEQLLDEVEENLLEEDREDFINEYYSELIFDKVPLEVIIDNLEGSYRERSMNDLEPVINEIIQINKDLKTMFEGSGIKYSTELPKDFGDFANIRSEDLEGRRSWYELLYDEYQYRLPKKPKTDPFGFSSIYDIDVPPSLFSNSMSTQAAAQAYQQKSRDRDTYRNELSSLKQQGSEQKKILEDYGKPHGMWGGLMVLIYASIVGIAYPVTLLPYPLQTYNDEATRILILLLFLSQLLALFIYLGISMYSLTKDEKAPE
ncbi:MULTISPECIES: hypothetical protein [unclassified Planococcus (in: firmicutes)]|uniref:hypothetical protein n=1 Tax=unclassified Planococcus (in: firmicutes) TaxID=2662419 RepID=UPI000C348022|nr:MULTISPECIES: hypothetical protein [unclassified Planococcus (in: firmicutes)]AUD14934.1 hypothetical protein CW734_16235 [Planococcus sp. MB-3u-03]PKG45259.1 hypothetical protein CXF66_15775 [Planococcus sp. Urea-trap-24]PKG87601.1 hypothetical protein CXF91_16625 [Planococcus sp. Urea-3u-39]PKH36737.1 hypothetical protein CXF77_14005 [Planococcus sp. MB-3u-09]